MSGLQNIAVPVEWCTPGSIQSKDKAVTVPLSEFRDGAAMLKPSILLRIVFFNLTFGALAGLGTAQDGCPSKIVWTNARKAQVLAACAKFKIARLSRPTAQEALDLAADLDIPTSLGIHIFKDLLARILSWIFKHVTAKTLPNILHLLTEDDPEVFKEHTRLWSPSTMLHDMLAQTSIKHRTVKATGHNPDGIARIVRAASSILASKGVFDSGIASLPDKIVPSIEVVAKPANTSTLNRARVHFSHNLLTPSPTPAPPGSSYMSEKRPRNIHLPSPGPDGLDDSVSPPTLSFPFDLTSTESPSTALALANELNVLKSYLNQDFDIIGAQIKDLAKRNKTCEDAVAKIDAKMSDQVASLSDATKQSLQDQKAIFKFLSLIEKKLVDQERKGGDHDQVIKVIRRHITRLSEVDVDLANQLGGLVGMLVRNATGRKL